MEKQGYKPGHELVRPQVPMRTTGPLSAAEVDDFYRDGFVVKRGLVTGEQLAGVLKARESLPKLHSPDELYGKLGFNVWDQCERFREVATKTMAAAAAQLTPAVEIGVGVGVVVPEKRELVALKDAYFVLQGEQKGCNFHVDDEYFWPATRDAAGPGVNVWVALDEVRASEVGGGLAVASGSHSAEYLDCREAIRGRTCDMAEIAPPKAKRLETVVVTPDMRPGDAIIHTRFLFHRADPFKHPDSTAARAGIARYSVRFMPANAMAAPCTSLGGKLTLGTHIRLADADPSQYPSCILQEK